jgi:hypothetical protein
MSKIACLIGLMLLIGGFAWAAAPVTRPTSQPATASAPVHTIVNAAVEFNGTTYYIAEHDPALPANLLPALTFDAEGLVTKTFLLRVNKGKIEQAIEIHCSFGGIVVMDLDGDGKDEIILSGDPTRFAKLFPRAKVFWVFDAIEYTTSDAPPGMRSSLQSSIGGGVGDLLCTTPSGDLESVVGSSFNQVGLSSYASYHCTFADLFGDGRPIPCRIVTWVKDPPVATVHPAKAQLDGYWFPDKPGGTWMHETVGLDIPDSDDQHAALKGLLDPATCKLTPLMIQLGRIRAILPKGWTASLASTADISIRPAGPVSYCKIADLEGRGRDFVATTYGYLQTNVVALGVHVVPRDNAAAGPDVLTADQRIAVGKYPLAKDEVFFDPAVAKQYAEVEAAVRRAVALPISASATQPASAPATTQ